MSNPHKLIRSMSINRWMELLVGLVPAVALLTLVGAVRKELLVIGFDPSESTALDRSDYSRERN
jgi:hypothetical protein